MNFFDVIKKPIVTEKAENLRAQNIYIFEVDLKANKKLVKEAVKAVYGIMPEKVNIVRMKARKKIARYRPGYKASRKKAYVFLNKKDKLEIFEGV